MSGHDLLVEGMRRYTTQRDAKAKLLGEIQAEVIDERLRELEAERDTARDAGWSDAQQRIIELEAERNRWDLQWDLRELYTASVEAENQRLREAIEGDIADAKAACGGDGLGCKDFRPYYGDDAERRYRKCGQCPMEALSNCRAALNTGKGD